MEDFAEKLLKDTLRKQLDDMHTQQIYLERIECILYKMERLAIISAADVPEDSVDREKLQEELEYLKSELDKICKTQLVNV